MAHLAVTLRDIYGRTTTKRFETTAATVAAAQGALDDLLDSLADVSDLGQIKVLFECPLVVTTPVAAQALSNIDVGATLHCELASAMGYGLKIPAIKAALLNGDGSVKIAETAITTYVANFETGGAFLVSDGELIAALLSGELDK